MLIITSSIISIATPIIAIFLYVKNKRKINEINEIKKTNLIQYLARDRKYRFVNSDPVYFGHLNGRIERVL